MRLVLSLLLLSISLFALGSKVSQNSCKIVFGSVTNPQKVVAINFFSFDEYKMYKDKDGQYQFKDFSTQTQNFLTNVKKNAQEDCKKYGAKTINIVEIKHQVDKDKFYFSAPINYLK